MNLMTAGIIPLLLVLHCKLMSGKPLPMQKGNLMCNNSSQCNHHVFSQVRHQVADLNRRAPGLLNLYVEKQGHAFNPKKLNHVCPLNATFPSINQTNDEKEILIALYKIFVFFQTSLGNISIDQEVINSDATQLLQNLNQTSEAVRGLLSNLTCLLCSVYNVTHVDVTYGSSSSWKHMFQSKKQGCQVLRWYKGVISEAASILKKLHKPV
ncbi:leukemia inhibitory factor [Sphaerodactylus townsendi]|uniref:leukemia inhibitory factor n=1 Tax=Sphaerodactylus townsendi TaxID=933632 RepID=UPI002026089D|nr:leukemia inhibitory factor [Sphaerodactylus townsendi]